MDWNVSRPSGNCQKSANVKGRPLQTILYVRVLLNHAFHTPKLNRNLVLPLGITVTYLEGRQAAEANRLFSIFAKRVVRSLRVKVH